PTAAAFTLTPRKKFFADGGRGRLGIRLYHKLNLVDHVQLNVLVAGSATALPSKTEETAIRAVFPPIEPPDVASAARALNISISKTEADGQDQYWLAFVAGDKE